MKVPLKILSAFLAIALSLSGCAISERDASESEITANTTSDCYFIDQAAELDVVSEFSGPSDERYLSYLSDQVYLSLLNELAESNYCIDEVKAIYLSPEYISELTYNCKENSYFGYSLSELDEYYDDEKYVFDLGENGQMVVRSFERYDETFEKVIQNVAVGSGVILLCVTVSTATLGAAPAVSSIFFVAAESAAIGAGTGALLGSIAGGTITALETKDPKEALRAAALRGSEEFKWGAIVGTATGGISAKLGGLSDAAKSGTSFVKELAKTQRKTKCSADVAKRISNSDEAKLYRKVKLRALRVNNSNLKTNEILIRKINLKLKDKDGLTNLERMHLGKAPLDKDGVPYELHHIGQQDDSPLAILTKVEHDSAFLHSYKGPTCVNHSEWTTQRSRTWKYLAEQIDAKIIKM